MATLHRLLMPVAVTALLCSCAGRAGMNRRDVAALDAVTSRIWQLPLTTTSDPARNHFLQGLRELDLGRFLEANEHFKLAVAADSSFALASLYAGNTGNSLEEFKQNFERAERHAAHASEAEGVLIQMARKGLDNDIEGELALARQLTEKHPDSPRAWLALGGIQAAMNRNDSARASMTKAIELAPRLFVAHTNLGNSYLFGEPRDFAKALEHMQHAEQLAPHEPWPHDLLGDVYRAQTNLPKAAEEYTRGHELSPTDASLLQQRGHVNTFLGNYAAARADYDSAIALGRANEKAAYVPFRALVSVYQGNPQAAIDELNRLVASVDGMGVPGARGVKIGALTNGAIIAIHTRNFPAAEQALRQRSALMMEQAAEVGRPAFRRGQEADIAYFDAWVAARKGDYASARRLADRVATLVQPDANPRKMEPVHELRGYIALYQGSASEAATHFRQGNLDDPYIKYQLALGLEGAGNAAEARSLFRQVADYNFNNVGFALVRQEARRKAG